MSKVFQQKLILAKPEIHPKSTFYCSLAFLGCGPVLVTKKKQKNIQYITKCDVKVMTHLNFGRNNGKPADVTSWSFGMWGAS